MASNRFKIKQEWQEGGYRVVIDEHLDENSSNPVANWVLKQAIEQGGGGGGGGVWGTITGTITDQTDLIQYINAHGAGTWGAITGTLTNQTDLVQYINNALANYYTKNQVYTKAETDALIPTVNDATLTVQKNGTTVDTFTANASANKTINITVPTTAADVDALPDTTKYAASLTLSLNSTTYEMTATLKDQDGNTLGTAQTIDLPIESVVVSGRYDSTTKEVVLVLQSGSEIKFSVADLVSGLQPEITSTNKLNADLVDDSTSTHKFTTASDISKLAGIEANANNYVLPKATTSTLGGVKVGEHLEIDSDGVLETDDCVALYDPNDPQSQIPLIDTDMIVDGAITTDKIANEAVTEDKIDSDLLDDIAYVGSEVAGGTSQIQTTDIADSAVTADKLADSAVTADKLADSAVTTAKLDGKAVTTDKIDWHSLSSDIAKQRSSKSFGQVVALISELPSVSPSWGPMFHSSAHETITINGTAHTNDNTTICGVYMAASDGVSDGSAIVRAEIGIVTYSNTASLHGKLVYRYRHGSFGNKTTWNTIS